MLLTRSEYRDYSEVMQSYAMEIKSVDPGSGCRIVPDSDMSEDILFAVSLLNDAKS